MNQSKKNGVTQQMETSRTVEQKKEDILLHLKCSYGIITIACRRAGVGRTMFYEYLNDPLFKDKVDELNENFVSYAETRLLDLVRTGDRSAIIFYLKAKGKGRGYK